MAGGNKQALRDVVKEAETPVEGVSEVQAKVSEELDIDRLATRQRRRARDQIVEP